jgi:hypothetical protein
VIASITAVVKYDPSPFTGRLLRVRERGIFDAGSEPGYDMTSKADVGGTPEVQDSRCDDCPGTH